MYPPMYRKFDLFKKKSRAIEYPRALPDPAERLAECEHKLCERVGIAHAVVFDRPSHALYCAARALELPESSEIVVPALERAAVPLALELAGLRIALCDTHPITHTLEPESLPERITKCTEAVLVSTLFGHPAHFTEIRELCGAHKIRMIEYSAEGLGGIYRGIRNGLHGDVAVVGFPAAEGAAALTADARLRERLVRLRNAGIDEASGDAPSPSLDFRPTHAALLEMLKALRDLDEYLEMRYSIVKEYARRMERHPHAVFPPTITTATHTYRSLVVRVENPALRDALAAKIRSLGFPPRPEAVFLPEFERYRKLPAGAARNYPNAMKLHRTALELPLDIAAGSSVPEEIDRVITA